MDSALYYAETYFFSPYIYPSYVSRNNINRQITSLYLIAASSSLFLYFTVAAVNYYLFFDHQVMKHPLFRENQLVKEIEHSCSAIAVLSFLSIPFLLLIANGHTNLRENYDTAMLGMFSIVPEVIACLLFVDLFSYAAHRMAHHRYFYKHIHKQHHSYKVTTPFASHAFHPIDGLLQVIPYYLCGIFVPIQKHVFLGVMVFGNVWAVFIHDGEIRLPEWAETYINGARHHADHHLTFKHNYGQFLTFWDRIFGSFKQPSNVSDDVHLNKEHPLGEKVQGTNKRKRSRSRLRVHSLDMRQYDWLKVELDEEIRENVSDDVFVEDKYSDLKLPTYNNYTQEMYLQLLKKHLRVSCCNPRYFCRSFSSTRHTLRQRAYSSRE